MGLVATYPNLELLAYKAELYVNNDKNWKVEYEKKKKENPYAHVELNADVFSQMWGNTCTGFDICEDGSPVMSGCAMTKEYTTVFHELLTDVYIVFFGSRCCYMVDHANKKFLDDLKNHQLASLSRAMKLY